MARIDGFPPIVSSRARVLILGSMPSEESLRQGQYYAHPRNHFWQIMGELFGAGTGLPYPVRVRKLVSRKVAVWDVLKRCERRGSLDSSIRRETEEANDFTGFFRRYPGIRVVFFNGAKAEHLFARHVRTGLGAQAARLRFERMPSTSPAHASRSFKQKLAQWQRIQEVI